MSRAARRRRGAALLAVALACGGLAASEVQDRTRAAEARIGPPVPVVVARTDLRAGVQLEPSRVARLLTVRQVPERFAPPDSLASPADAAGARLAAPVPAGGYVGAADLARGPSAHDERRARGGERAVEIAVAAGADLADAGPGARVDVIVTTGSEEGRGRSYLALEDVELLAARAAGGAGDAAGGSAARATAIATLRVTLRQAVMLTAAQSFAREIRVLLRPPGEPRSGRSVEWASGL